MRAEPFERIVQKIDPKGRLLSATPLEGGVSAQVIVLEWMQGTGQRAKAVVRRHGALDLQRNPTIAADEFKLLKLLNAKGFPSPAPYLFDPSGEILATPYLVIEHMEGQSESNPPDLASFIFQLATCLVNLHTLDTPTLELAFLPEKSEEVTRTLNQQPGTRDVSLEEGRILNALQARWPPSRANGPVLLHGDFWPGNILWKEGRLVAVIDWEDAGRGDPLADVANARLEILWAWGRDAMQAFTTHYAAMTALDFTHLPLWDLVAALRPASKMAGWGLAESSERKMREELRGFVEQAVDRAPGVT